MKDIHNWLSTPPPQTQYNFLSLGAGVQSSCVYCPFHSNAEWRRLRDEEPAEFARAVQFEQDLQAIKRQTDNLAGVPFLHCSLVPLSVANLGEPHDPRQQDMFQNECAGMCGV